MTKEDFETLVAEWEDLVLADENDSRLDAMESAIRNAPWEYDESGGIRRKHV